MPDEPFAQSFCKVLDAIDVDVCRMQSRRRYVFPESPANKETLALAFCSHGHDLLLEIQAPFSPKYSLPEKTSLRSSFGNVDEKMTDLIHDPVLA